MQAKLWLTMATAATLAGCGEPEPSECSNTWFGDGEVEIRVTETNGEATMVVVPSVSVADIQDWRADPGSAIDPAHWVARYGEDSAVLLEEIRFGDVDGWDLRVFASVEGTPLADLGGCAVEGIQVGPDGLVLLYAGDPFATADVAAEALATDLTGTSGEQPLVEGGWSGPCAEAVGATVVRWDFPENASVTIQRECPSFWF